MKRNYFLLLSLSQTTAVIGKEFMVRIKTKVDPTAAPLWIDSRGIGVFLSTELPARQIWRQAFPDTLTFDQRQVLRALLIVQVGSDFAGLTESKPMAWLNSHTRRQP